MSESKHTSGPWYRGKAVGNEPIMIFAPGGNPVADLAYMNGAEEADADLIASAPELLAALERVLPEMETGGWSETARRVWLEDARAAIAKARGEA